MTAPVAITTPLAELDEPDGAPAPSDRASASMGQAVETSGAVGQRSAAPVRGPSAELVAWFQRVITHPVSFAAGRAAAAEQEQALGARTLEDLVTPSGRLGAADRLAIYHHAYRARLVECVADDYRALAKALGGAPFEALARSYVAAHPSRSWDLVPYAAGLPPHILAATTAWSGPLTRAAAADLARLEWAMVEVLHAPSPPAIALDALAALPPERGGEVRLVPSPALRVLAFDHDVHALYKSALRGEPGPDPLERPSFVAVWRKGAHIWRMALTAVTYQLLTALVRGAPLGEALGAVPEDASEDVMRWFAEWMQDGFFAALDLPGAE